MTSSTRPAAGPPADPLAGFSPATRAWFTGAFPGPTTAQTGAWAAVRLPRGPTTWSPASVRPYVAP
ncbi:hypothetical protein, partial [Pengzhenrongella sp.]|uniref:hypothetical protein n=1 Tax=Pengzhenrongella sp. TaxID=2888820 RepID=UPI002F9300FA